MTDTTNKNTPLLAYYLGQGPISDDTLISTKSFSSEDEKEVFLNGLALGIEYYPLECDCPDIEKSKLTSSLAPFLEEGFNEAIGFMECTIFRDNFESLTIESRIDYKIK